MTMLLAYTLLMSSVLQPSSWQAELPIFRLAWKDPGKSIPKAPDLISKVLTTSDGGVIAVGSTSNPKGSSYETDVLIRKHTEFGVLVWEKRFDTFGKGKQDSATDAVLDGSGNLYVAISVALGNYDGFTLCKISAADGSILWTNSVDTGNERATAYDLVIDKQGFPVQVGGFGSNAQAEIFATKWSPDGKTVWTHRWKSPDGKVNQARGAAVSSNGDVYLVGVSETAAGGEDAIAIRLDGASGTPKWAKHVRGAGIARDSATAVAVDEAGDAYITGSLYLQGSTNSVFAARLDAATGSVKWQTPLLEPRNAGGEGVGIHVDRNGVTMGASMNLLSANGPDLTVSKFSLEGKEVWRANANSADALIDEASAFTVDKYGNAYIAGGSTKRNGMPNAFVARVNPEGKIVWQYLDSPTAPSQARPGSVAVDDDSGTVYVGSGSVDSTDTDWSLIAIEQSPEAQPLNSQVLLGKTVNLQLTSQSAPAFVQQSRFSRGVEWSTEVPKRGKFSPSPARFDAPTDAPGPVDFGFTLTRKGLRSSSSTIKVNVMKPPPGR